MRRAVAGLVLAGAALAVSVTAQQKKQPEIDLQAAIRTETVDGNLNGAIKQYGVIVAKYKDDRAVTAMALVHMAECFQKLGDAEARKIYEQVVSDYTDQKEAVKIARARLGGAVGAARESGIALRKVWTGDASGTISPDGRRLSFIDWVSPSTADWGRLLLHDVVAGTDRPLTSRKEGHAFGSAISRDGIRSLTLGRKPTTAAPNFESRACRGMAFRNLGDCLAAKISIGSAPTTGRQTGNGSPCS